MNVLRWVFLGLFSSLFLVTGVLHFAREEFFLRIMPPYLPWHRPLVLISGVFEIVLAVLLLIPRTRRFAAYGLIALLVAVFPANIYLFQNQHLVPAPPLVHLLRLPFQAALIFWAYQYTKPDSAAAREHSK